MSAGGAGARRFGVVTAVRLGRDPDPADGGALRRRADAVRRSLVEEIRAGATPPPKRRGAGRRRRAR